MTTTDVTVQCPCGYKIEDESKYNILFLKKEQREIDILCPNASCFLGELGFIKFIIVDDQPVLELARFYSPFVTWNATQLGEEDTRKRLVNHLKLLITKKIRWSMIIEETHRITDIQEDEH